MFWYGNDTSGWGIVLMAVSMVVFWGAVVAGIVLLVRSAKPAVRGRESSPPLHSAEQILAERFARGKIDQTEYDARLAVLRQRAGS